MGKKLTYDEFVKRSNIIHNNKYEYNEGKYVNTSTKTGIICPVHGEFWQKPNKHLLGRGCPECAKILIKQKKRRTFQEFEEKANEIHNWRYTYHHDYKNGTSKIVITCPIHGDFEQTPQKHLQGQGCPKCAINKNADRTRLNKEEFIKRADIIHNSAYDYCESKYVNYKTPLKIFCHKIGHNNIEHGVFWQTPDAHLSGHGCPKCGNQISRGEEEIRIFLEEECGLQVETHNNSIISPYEIDIYIPEKKIGIEYNGLIWHSTKYKKDKNYHLSKTEKCNEKGIHLIHIFEDEWKEKCDIIKNLLKREICLFNTNTNNMSLQMKYINYKQISDFLEKYDIQGKCRATYHIACYLNNENIACISFLKRKDVFVLKRFTVKPDYEEEYETIFQEMFNFFLKDKKPNKIEVYSSRNIVNCQKNIYLDNGFQMEKFMPPNYKDIKVCGKTYKIWNCGYIKYIFSVK